MPFRSSRQRKFMWLNHPDIARKWTEEFGSKVVKKVKKVIKKIKKGGKNGKRRTRKRSAKSS